MYPKAKPGVICMGYEQGNILKKEYRSYPNTDILIGGPPCPPWSGLGRHGGALDPRAQVFDETVQVVIINYPLAGTTYLLILLKVSI